MIDTSSRYTIVPAPELEGGQPIGAILLDTHTGRTWWCRGGQWIPMTYRPAPAEPAPTTGGMT
jgi:hypothetical protein